MGSSIAFWAHQIYRRKLCCQTTATNHEYHKKSKHRNSSGCSAETIMLHPARDGDVLKSATVENHGKEKLQKASCENILQNSQSNLSVSVTISEKSSSVLMC